MSSLRDVWKRMNEGWMGYVLYIILGMVAAIGVTSALGASLNTSVPLVAVLSGSMDHGINDEAGNNKYPCANFSSGYRESFDNWWSLCQQTYTDFGITKEQFAGFPFKNGFKRGDIPIIRNDGNFQVGDIIVYSLPSQSVPIIHRIVEINTDGTYQTKGDHNSGQNSYERSVQKGQIRGKVVFIVPYLGYLRVLLPMN